MVAKELWKKREIAEFYRVSESTVDGWMKEGRIKYTQTPGGQPRFLPPTIEPEYRKVEDTIG